MKLGVIGAGNMGSAIIKGYTAAGANPDDIMVSGHHPEKLRSLEEETKVHAADTKELASACDMIMIAVKPKNVNDVLSEISPFLTQKKVIISIAAGKTISQLTEACGSSCPEPKIIRVMPNTPAMAGQGMSALCRSSSVNDDEFALAEQIFAGVGKASEVPESMMDAVTGLSGSGPAYVYMFIEALADGAVLSGMPRAQAYEFAAQTVLGSSQMVLMTGKNPGELKDAVCSPAGTTIEGVRTLEAGNFRSTVMEAVIAAAEKSADM